MDDREKRYRIVGVLPTELEDEENVTFDDIKENLSKTQGIPIQFKQTHWFAIYRVHHRCIETFRQNSCFLAGDSAHVHSPAGGQGMNTGLQDAYNLAWKLAWYLKGRAPISLLDTYNEERLPVAHDLVNSTDRAFSAAVSKGGIVNFIKLNILPYIAGTVMSFDIVRNIGFKRVSQIYISYDKHSLAQNNISLNCNAPFAGNRLPFITLYNRSTQQMESLYHKLNGTDLQVVIWLSNSDKIGEKEATAIHTYCDENYDGIQTHTIHNITENMPVFEKLHITQSTLYVIRPDNYIGYIGRVDDIEGLRKYMNLYYVEMMT